MNPILAVGIGLIVVYFLFRQSGPTDAYALQIATLVKFRWKTYITKWSAIYAVNPKTIAAMICQESKGNSKAIRPEPHKNDASYGLMQILYNTARSPEAGNYKGTTEGLYDPDTNLKHAVKYFKWQLNRYGGDEKKAIIAYNGGSYPPPLTISYGHYNKVMRFRKAIDRIW